MGRAQREGQQRRRPLRVYRTTPSVVIGVVLVAAGLLVGVPAVVQELRRSGGALGVLAVVVVVVVLAWVVLLRPCVRIETGGVLVRNLVQDVTLPWESLGEVTHRWSLELTDTAGHRHSSWAVPVKRELRPRSRIDDYAETTTRARSQEGTHAKAVAGEVERHWQDWRRAGGRQQPASRAERRWALDALVPLAVAGVLVVLAALV